jgi:hypothetical protein
MEMTMSNTFLDLMDQILKEGLAAIDALDDDDLEEE